MHVWCLEKWMEWLDLKDPNRRAGLRVRYDKDVNPEVKGFCKEYFNWLRWEYSFPVRIRIYIKDSKRIRAKDGEMVCGTFWWPGQYGEETYIKIATGDYEELKQKYGFYQAKGEILCSIAHELTHYFQYINKLDLTPVGEERQAGNYAFYILWEYEDYLKDSKKKCRHLWRYYRWTQYINIREKGHCTGLILRICSALDDERMEDCRTFVSRIKSAGYFFPIRCVIHIKDEQPQKTGNRLIRSIFHKSDEGSQYSVIIIKAGDIDRLLLLGGKTAVYQTICFEIAYTLSLYFQWINHLNLTEIGKKRQATLYAKRMLEELYCPASG